MIPSPQSNRPYREGNRTTFRVWAPHAKQVDLVLDDHRIAMTSENDGHFTTTVPDLIEGQRYAYSLDGGTPRPDPCTLHQPDGIHHSSALYFPTTPEHLRPSIPQSDVILYEMHIGTFTDLGTFDAAIARLDDLVDLGINTLEILPIAQFPGHRNWGYDGVHPYCAQHSYGGPAPFQRFIDAAHARGLAVILDVVFNHLGPEGNYLAEFGPYFTKRNPTPWGPGFNFDDPEAAAVRDWVLDCVAMWIHDFHLDGLRLDAVHAIVDRSETHLLSEIKRVAGPDAFIIAESLQNDIEVIRPLSEKGKGLDAEWNEDFHHAIHAWMTGEKQEKYADYGTLTDIKTVFRETYSLTGRQSHYYQGPWGKPVGDTPGDRFVISLQNHDLVGNRARGDRLASLVTPAQLRLGACLTILSPFLPMLFMGEEYGEKNPFAFFCSFGDADIIRNVRRGRRRDFALNGDVLDPQAEDTFTASKLDWDWPNQEPQRELRQLYRDLIALRQAEPALRDLTRKKVELHDSQILRVTRGDLICYFSLSEEPTILPEGKIRWRSESANGDLLAPLETVVIHET